MEKKKTQKVITEKKPQLIGIGGIGHNVGCTHFAIMLANYLAGYRRKKTALLEWNRSGDFERLERICNGRNREGVQFRVLEVDFYKNAGREELAEVLRSNVDEILIDFGNIEKEQLSEIARCEKQFLIGSFSEWQEEVFWNFVRENGAGNGNWQFLAVFGSEETRKEFRRRPGIFTERIPFSADAFSVTRESCTFFHQLMNP